MTQISLYTALTAGAYVLFSAASRGQQQSRRRFVLSALMMSVCGALLAAPQLLPSRELQSQGARAQIGYEYFASFSFPPRQLPALIFPYFFGGAHLPPYRIPYWGTSGIFVTCGYVGMLGLLLALIALIGYRKRSIVWFWAGVAIAALILSFGGYLPFGLSHWLYKTPVYNLFRAQFRHTFEFTFACGVLAGLGMDYLATCGRTRALRAGAALFSLVVLCTLAAYAFFGRHFANGAPLPTHSGSLTNPEALIPLFFFVASLALLWNYALRRSRFSGALLALALFGDLISYGHFLEWRAYTFSIAERLADPPSVKYIKQREPDPNSFRIISHSAQPYGLNYEMLDFPYNSIARELQSANGYDVLRPPRPAKIMGEMTPEGTAQDLSCFGAKDRGLDLLNVKYLLLERAEPSGDQFPSPGRWRKLSDFGAVELYENLRVLPRAWFVSQVRIMPGDDVLRTIREGTNLDGSPFDPAAVALLESEDLEETHSTPPDCGDAAGAEVAMTRYEPQRIELKTRHSRPGLLVTSEVWFPGWEVRVDGGRTRIYRTNYTLRGVAIPAGEHRVEFVFTPSSFRLGMVCSAIGLLALFVGACFARWSRTKGV